MKSDDAKKKNSNDYIWESNRKSYSKLPTSEYTMDESRRAMIRRALDLDIIDVRSYAGYRGDMLVEFTTMGEDTVSALKKIAEDLGMEVTVRQNPLQIYQVYCIAVTKDIYGLKV
ncbi:MAG: hypothetical protein PHO65_02570 [Sulfurovum sp.]|nr:hypothetical protein [Sulfurovum sp.]